MTEMSKRLKELRKESNLSQDQLAKYLNVDQSMVTKLENGSRKLSVSLIDKICNLFGCTEEYLLGECEDYIPLSFAFRSSGINEEDLESIAVINRIAMNLRYMNKLMGDK